MSKNALHASRTRHARSSYLRRRQPPPCVRMAELEELTTTADLGKGYVEPYEVDEWLTYDSEDYVDDLSNLQRQFQGLHH